MKLHILHWMLLSEDQKLEYIERVHFSTFEVGYFKAERVVAVFNEVYYKKTNFKYKK